MKRLCLSFALAALAAAALAPAAQAAFGLNSFSAVFEADEAGEAASEAATHPYSYTTSFGIDYSGEGEAALPDGEIKDLRVRQPRGFVGDPGATPRCSSSDFLSTRPGATGCPADTQVGVAEVDITTPGNTISAKVYNLDPPPGVPLRLGFKPVGLVPVVIDGAVETRSPYDIVATLRNVRQTLKVFAASLTLWGVPGDPVHETGAVARPLITLPSSCGGPLQVSYETTSWQGGSDSGSTTARQLAGCGALGFHPTVSSQATTDTAAAPSGLDFSIDFADEGLTSPTGQAQSTISRAEVTLPAGVTANPSLAEGIGTCSLAQVGVSVTGEGDEAQPACPADSKIGTVEVQTPLLEEAVGGDVYLATPNDPATAAPENPFDSLLAFYIVLENEKQGILIKLPAEVAPDPQSGRLITTVGEIPQLPFSHFGFHFREGQRAPLISPPRCGAYTTHASLTPSARPGEAVDFPASFQINKGPGGGACPSAAPFHPEFEAGSLNNNAATYSPFVMRIARADGEQDLTRFAATLPPGLIARLAGVSECPEAQIALARSKSGRAELASPSCPSGSRIGSTLAAAGVGSELTYVPGSLYLAGPFNGDPLSVVAVTPAVAGPFDVGAVVVREALRIDPRSTLVSVDPTASEPIPHILAGIPLNLRELRVSVDRDAFTLNPTSCEASAVTATLWGSYLDLFDPAASTAEQPVSASSRYQAAGCARLGFKPRLALRLIGGTRRGGHPSLRGLLRPRAHDANLRRLVLRLPRSAFLDQAHIRTICTRVQFAAGSGHGEKCPKAAIYGHAKAYTPLLSEPLQGPVYLRSSSHNLPDLVAALHGIVDVEAVGRIDSRHGGIRTTFNAIPDAPISRVVIQMQGGKKGLVVNSTNLCRRPHRAAATMDAQNGRRQSAKPLVRPRCPKQRRHRRHRRPQTGP